MPSEHRKAAHITGLYTIVAALIGAAGGVGGTLLWTQHYVLTDARTQPANDTPQSNDLAPPKEPLPAASAGGDKTVSTEQSNQSTPQPTDSKTYITMKAYLDLFDDAGVPHLDIAEQYLGKQVDWTGYFHSMDAYAGRSDHRDYRVTLVADPQRFTGYIYCYFPSENAAQLRALKNDVKVGVTGTLSSMDTLEPCDIIVLSDKPTAAD